MNPTQQTNAEKKKLLLRGTKIVLPDGRPGIFLEFCKHLKSSAWVLSGGMDGPMTCVNVQGILDKTFKT